MKRTAQPSGSEKQSSSKTAGSCSTLQDDPEEQKRKAVAKIEELGNTTNDANLVRQLIDLGMISADPHVAFHCEMDAIPGGIATQRARYYQLKNSFFRYRTSPISPDPGYDESDDNQGPASAMYTQLGTLFDWIAHVRTFDWVQALDEGTVVASVSFCLSSGADRLLVFGITS